MMKRILLFALAMLPLVAGAQDVKQLKKQAKAGDAEAALALGRYHEKLEEYKKAEKYYRQAATPQADYELGALYLNGNLGKDTEADMAKGIGLLRRSAAAGNRDGRYWLAFCYSRSIGIEGKEDSSYVLFNQLAAEGDSMALLATALACYLAASQLDDPRGDFMVGAWLYDQGDYDRAIAQGGTRAFNLYSEAAERGSSYGMFLVGMCYIDGVYVQEDSEQAFQWFLRAAEAGNLQSCYNVGLMYHTGEGVKKNKKEAKRWLTLAADNGHPAADLLKTL